MQTQLLFFVIWLIADFSGCDCFSLLKILSPGKSLRFEGLFFCSKNGFLLAGSREIRGFLCVSVTSVNSSSQLQAHNQCGGGASCRLLWRLCGATFHRPSLYFVFLPSIDHLEDLMPALALFFPRASSSTFWPSAPWASR